MIVRNPHSAVARSRRLAGLGDAAQDAFTATAILNSTADALTGLVDPSVTQALNNAAQSSLAAGAAVQTQAGYNPPGVTPVNHTALIGLAAAGALAYFLMKRRR